MLDSGCTNSASVPAPILTSESAASASKPPAVLVLIFAKSTVWTQSVPSVDVCQIDLIDAEADGRGQRHVEEQVAVAVTVVGEGEDAV